MGEKVIILTGKVNKNSLSEYLSESFLEKVTELTIDFTEVNNIERSFYPEIAKIKKLEKDGKITFSSIYISSALQTELNDNGVNELFNIDLESHKFEKIKKTTQKEALTIIIPFIEATVNTFREQVDVDVSRSPMYQKGVGERLECDIISSLNINSRNFQGNIALCFMNNTILKIYNKMTSSDGNEVTDKVVTKAGELLTIIFGLVEEKLNDNKNYQIKKTAPIIASVKEEKIQQEEGPVMILPFECELGAFFIEIEILMSSKQEN